MGNTAAVSSHSNIPSSPVALRLPGLLPWSLFQSISQKTILPFDLHFILTYMTSHEILND